MMYGTALQTSAVF